MKKIFVIIIVALMSIVSYGQERNLIYCYGPDFVFELNDNDIDYLKNKKKWFQKSINNLIENPDFYRLSIYWVRYERISYEVDLFLHSQYEKCKNGEESIFKTIDDYGTVSDKIREKIYIEEGLWHYETDEERNEIIEKERRIEEERQEEIRKISEKFSYILN